MRLKRPALRATLALSLLLGISTFPAWGQLSTATINGTIADSSGAVVPGATIKLANVETGVERTAQSNSVGAYAILNIQPGTYTLEATSDGFRTSAIAPFRLAVNQTATFDFALEVGAVAEQVTVEAVAVDLQSSTAELGTVVAEKQVLDLPLNGRNFTQLLTLTTGASPISVAQNSSGFGSTSVGEFTYPSINGQSNRSNFFLMDGVNNQGAFVSTYAVPPIVDAIQEFKVQSHNYQAEFGMATGGVVNVVTKSGTNELHGTAWEFLRNNALDARNPFRTDKTALRQNMFGASAGGPIIKNKTFIFGAYQGFKNRRPANSLYRVPTSANLQGDFSDSTRQIFDPASGQVVGGKVVRTPFANNQIPVSRLDGGYLDYARQTIPSPTETGVLNRNQLDLTPTAQDQNELTGRIDHNFSATDSIWFRGSGSLYQQTGSGGRQTLESSQDWNNMNLGLSWAHTFGPSSILQVQWGRTLIEQKTGTTFRDVADDFPTSIGFDREFCCAFRSGLVLTPNVGVNGYFAGGESAGFNRSSDIYQYKANYSKIIGDHQLKFGGEFNDLSFFTITNDHNINFNTNGTSDPQNAGSTGNELASWLLDVPNDAARRDFFKTTRPGGIGGFYLQDSWRISSRLTFNYGLRYDRTWIPPIGEAKYNTLAMGTWDFNRGVYVLQAVPGTCAEVGSAPCLPDPSGALPDRVIVDPRGKLLHDFTDNWQPRLGLAYKITEKTVFRASFGRFFDNWSAVTQFSQNLGHTWPDVGRRLSGTLNTPSASAPTPEYVGKNPFPSATTPGPNPYQDGAFFTDPYLQNAASTQWNAGIQHQLTRDELLSVNYVGSNNTRLPLGGFSNVATTPGGTKPFPEVLSTNFQRSWGRSNYQSLQVQFRRRFVHGLAYTLNYTWSKSLDIGCSGFFNEGCAIQQPYNFNADRSVSGFDVPHNFNINWTYAIPVGRGSNSTGNKALDLIVGDWQINGIATFLSGQPYTVNVNGDIARIGNANGYMRPNVVGDPVKSNPDTTEWFNRSAFVAPPALTFGTAGRNILRADGTTNFDISVFRRFAVNERFNVEFRAESFNTFNSTQYGIPVSNFSRADFGQVTGTAREARQLQLGLKLIF
jgi:outer membrane receptor protein involved in Fe transport